MKITNKGRGIAQAVRAFLANVEQWTGKGNEFQETVYADDLPLNWSNSNSKSLDIVPQNDYWLDLLSKDILPANSGCHPFTLETNPLPHRYVGDRSFWNVAVYRFTINVFAEDAAYITVRVYFQWVAGHLRLQEVWSEEQWLARLTTGGHRGYGELRAKSNAITLQDFSIDTASFLKASPAGE